MHRPAVVAAALTTLALTASAAQAQTTTGAPPTTGAPSSTTAPSTTVPPTTTPAPPAPATGTLRLSLEKVNGRSDAVLAGDRFRVRGTVKPYVAGQKVVVRFYRGKKKLASKSVTVKASGSSGTFVLGYKAGKAGHITVRASHRATAELATLVAKGQGVDVLPLHVAAGSKGLAVRLLQGKLKALGYVIGQKGVYDARTARAVLAFRKVTGMARTEDATEDVFKKLASGAGAFKVRFPKQGHHVEANLALQVLALIDGSKVERIYPISSGKPSTPTVLGTFRVYSKTPGTNSEGMVYTSYFHGGYGIHGYAEVPTFAASHGCLRTPIPDAIPIFNWIKYGDYVDVYPG